MSAERVRHSANARAMRFIGARNPCETPLRCLYTEIVEDHLQARRAAVGVFVFDGLELKHADNVKWKNLVPKADPPKAEKIKMTD